LPYKITIELDEKEIRTDDVKRVANYLSEVLETMGYSYQIDCHKDGMKVMMGLESPPAEEQ
jgi:predicted RNA-binding protein Jag